MNEIAPFTTLGSAAASVVTKLAARTGNVERIKIESREKWLEMRKRDVTASVIAALFGLHPYETPLGLYVEKSGVDMPEIDNAVLRRGRLLESAVAQAVAEERRDWMIIKADEYLRDTNARIGCTPDFWIEGDKRGVGVLQAKTVAPSVFARDWTDDSPPFWVVLQAATEMMLSGVTWGAVAAMVVDPWKLALHIYEIPRHPTAEKKVRDAVAQFWADVDSGREPKVNYERDGDLLSILYPREVKDKVIDLTSDNHLPVLLDERATEMAKIKAAEARKEEIETEIKAKIGDAESIITNGWRATWKVEPRKGHVVAPSTPRVLRPRRTAGV